MRMRLGILAGILSLGLAMAQQPAPRDTANATIKGKKVSVEYGRPSLKGRSFAELTKGLPPDRMWRAGSEQVTTLTTEADLMIGDKKVPAGKYSVYVNVAEDGSRSLVLNKVLGQPLGKIWDQAPPELAKEPWPHFNYSKEIADQEVARVPLKKTTAQTSVDLFTIQLKPEGDGAMLKMEWGDEAWAVDLKPAKG